jgi:hypothetical protein
MEPEGSVQRSQKNLAQVDDTPNKKKVYQKEQFMAITVSIIITIITNIITQTFV